MNETFEHVYIILIEDMKNIEKLFSPFYFFSAILQNLKSNLINIEFCEYKGIHVQRLSVVVLL